MRSKRRIGRKKRTLKIRGGDLDNPDTKDFMNSKIEALEQKIAELEANIPVQIGYLGLLNNYRGRVPLWVNKNISIYEFWKYIGHLSSEYRDMIKPTIFLPAVYSLPNIRGLRINDCIYSFYVGNLNGTGRQVDYEEYRLLRERNVDALNEKYPGLFTL